MQGFCLIQVLYLDGKDANLIRACIQTVAYKQKCFRIGIERAIRSN